MWSLLCLGLENKSCLHSAVQSTATAVLDLLLLRWGRKTPELENLTKWKLCVFFLLVSFMLENLIVMFLSYDLEHGLYGYDQNKWSPWIFLILSKRKIHSDMMTMPVQGSCVCYSEVVLLCSPYPHCYKYLITYWEYTASKQQWEDFSNVIYIYLTPFTCEFQRALCSIIHLASKTRIKASIDLPIW